MLLGLWVRMFGDSERATHSLSLVFGLACIPLSFFAGRAVFSRRDGPRLRADRRARPVPHVLRAGDAHVRARGVPLAPRRVVVRRGDRPRRSARGLPVFVLRDGAARVLAQLGAVRLRRARGGDRDRRAPPAAHLRDRRRVRRRPLPARGCRRCSRRRSTPARRGRRGRACTTSCSRSGRSSAATRRSSRSRSSAASRSGRSSRTRRTEERTIVARARDDGRRARVVAAFISSQISPAWTSRYFAVVLGPLVLLVGRGDRRARAGSASRHWSRSSSSWRATRCTTTRRTRAGSCAACSRTSTRGELIISTHPEQTPVLRYYAGAGYRWATTLGPTPDPQIFDWRDAVCRLRRRRPQPTMRPAAADGRGRARSSS